MQRASILLTLLLTLGLAACDDHGHDHSSGDHGHDHVAETSAQSQSGDDHGHAHPEGEDKHNHAAPETEAFYGEEANTPKAEDTVTSDEDASQTHDHGEEGEHDHHH